jgi:hypothetical protein
LSACNIQIADIFDETADLLKIEGENRFRIRCRAQNAYPGDHAARS